MSQLTDEQVKVWVETLKDSGFSSREANETVDIVQKKLTPLPSYGEVFHNERVKLGSSYTSWEGLAGTGLEKDIEAGAQAVVRAFIEHELKPTLKANSETDAIVRLHNLIRKYGLDLITVGE